ncbi:MAG: TonB-dependent receptor plug domain-containing protein, partial [Acidobacteria bacterium]|nr:TonB-dependent receptor plug domain-containing protein [Acidobacteriota bacterium]
MESSFFRAAAGRSAAVLVLATCLTETTLLGAARFRLLDGAGRPVPGARVSIVGRAGSTLTGSAGELDPGALPPTPFELAVFSPSGAWLGLVRVERLAESGVQDLRLPSGSTAEVVVKESVAPSALAPPANAVTLVSRAELEEKRPSRLTETLDDVPGVWKSDESSSAVPSVRGLSRGRTLILLDDGRVSAERRAGPSASFVNPFSLENVEVVRGPGSVAYGSDALGGAVHAKTALPVPGVFAARYSLTAGAGGTPELSGGLSLNIPVGSMAITVQAQQRRQSDYDKPEGTQENSSSHDRGALVRWLVPLGSGGSRLYLGVQIDESRDMGKPSADQLLTRTYYPEENSRRFSLGLDLVDVAGFSALEARGFLGSYQLVTNRLRFPVPGTTRRLQSSDVDASDASFRV